MCIWTQVTEAQAMLGGLKVRTPLHLQKDSVFGEQGGWGAEGFHQIDQLGFILLDPEACLSSVLLPRIQSHGIFLVSLEAMLHRQEVGPM